MFDSMSLVEVIPDSGFGWEPILDYNGQPMSIPLSPVHFTTEDLDFYLMQQNLMTPSGMFRTLPDLVLCRSNRTDGPRPVQPIPPIQARSTEFPFLLSTNNKPASCLTTRFFIRGTLPSRYSLTRLLCLIPCHWLRSLTAASGGNPFLTIMVNRCPFLSQRFTSPPFKTLTSI